MNNVLDLMPMRGLRHYSLRFTSVKMQQANQGTQGPQIQSCYIHQKDQKTEELSKASEWIPRHYYHPQQPTNRG